MKLRFALLLAVAAVGVAFSSTSVFAQAEPLTRASLHNAEYRPWNDGTAVQLVDGKYSERDEEGGLWAWLEQYEFGDLNGDSAEDAAAVLVWHGGGSGTFYTLVVVLNEAGVPFHAGTVSLDDASEDGNNGDRVVVHDLRIVGDTIEVDLRVHTSPNGLCCPNLDIRNRYRYSSEAGLLLLDHDPWKKPVIWTLQQAAAGLPMKSIIDDLVEVFFITSRRLGSEEDLESAKRIPDGVRLSLAATSDDVAVTAHHRCSSYEYIWSQHHDIVEARFIIERRLRAPQLSPDPTCIVPDDGTQDGEAPTD